jgi:hypothetical protein
VLDRTKTQVKEERASKKAPMTDAEAKELLGSVDHVVLVRGKSRRELPAQEATLEDLRGPTGGFRAPMVRKGKRLLVGFNLDALEDVLGV